MNGIVAEGDKEDIDLAVQAAANAFENGEWSHMAPSERGRILMRAANLMWERLDELAEIESRDNGLTINETKYIAMPATIDVLEFYAGMANKITGVTLASPPKVASLPILSLMMQN